MRTYSGEQLAWHTRIAMAVMRDPKAMRRGVSVVRVHFDDWREMGHPFHLVILNKPTPVEPTSTRRGYFTWHYARRRKAWHARDHHAQG